MTPEVKNLSEDFVDHDATSKVLSEVDTLHLQRRNSMFASVRAKINNTKDNLYDLLPAISDLYSLVGYSEEA